MSETVTILRADLHKVVIACLRYLPDDVHEDVREAFSRLDDARKEAAEDIAEAPASAVPPGRYGRIEIPGYRENEGWIAEESRFGLQVAVVRDRDGAESAVVTPGPACRIVWLAEPVAAREPAAALTAGGWDEETDEPDEGPF